MVQARKFAREVIAPAAAQARRLHPLLAFSAGSNRSAARQERGVPNRHHQASLGAWPCEDPCSMFNRFSV